MKTTTAIIATIILSLGLLNANAQQTKRLTADKHNEYGIVYKLPTTALQIEVQAQQTIRTAGPYYQYAKKYLGTENVITKNEEIWQITSAAIRTYGVPDDSVQYLMQLKPSSISYVNVDENGVLLAINHEIQPSNLQSPISTPNPQLPTLNGTHDEYLKYVTGDFLASQSSSKRAQILAESLIEIREAKINLSKGTAETMPTDGQQLQLMLQSLDEQEKALTEAFTGTTQTRTFSKTYTYIPQDNADDILFRMSDFAGFVDASDYSGEPVYLKIQITQIPEMPTDEKGEEKRIPKDAVIYNIPGTATVSLTHNGKNLLSEEFEFAQFGTRFGLNPNLFNSKKEPSFLILDPATGSIRELGTVIE